MRKGFTLLEFVTVCAILAVAFYFVLIWPHRGHGNRARARDARARIDTLSLAAALKAYDTEYNTLPTGTQPTIIRALCGDNLRQIVFLEISEDARGTNGEFLDPWRTPYRITHYGSNDVVITSAGPDGRFDDEDDITNKQQQ